MATRDGPTSSRGLAARDPSNKFASPIRRRSPFLFLSYASSLYMHASPGSARIMLSHAVNRETKTWCRSQSKSWDQ